VVTLTKKFLDEFVNFNTVTPPEPEPPKEEFPTPKPQPSFLETLLLLSVFELKVEISNCLHSLVSSVMQVKIFDLFS
jgi:hypothetical protein